MGLSRLIQVNLKKNSDKNKKSTITFCFSRSTIFLFISFVSRTWVRDAAFFRKMALDVFRAHSRVFVCVRTRASPICSSSFGWKNLNASLEYFGIEFHSSLVILLLQQFVNSRFEQTTQKSHMLYHLFTLLSIQFVDEIIYIYLLFS